MFQEEKISPSQQLILPQVPTTAFLATFSFASDFSQFLNLSWAIKALVLDYSHNFDSAQASDYSHNFDSAQASQKSHSTVPFSAKQTTKLIEQ